MAKVTQKSGLAGKLGQAGQRAVAEHKDDPISMGGGSDLPDGISGGIAQLAECKFDTYKDGDNQGEYYFLAAGVVQAPETHDGVMVRGLRTQIMEPVCETPNRSRKTIEEHVAWVLNEMRKLGVDTTGLTVNDLEATAEALKQEAPFFRFRTWKGKPTPQFPNPRVQEQWKGACDYDGEGGTVTAVDDQTEAVDEEPAEVVEDEQEETATVDYSELGAAADNGDEDAASQLDTVARERGLDPEEYETWAALGDALAGAEPAEEEAAEEEQAAPQKGEVWYYRKPRTTKWIEVEVTAVFANGKVNLKNLDTQESYKSIPVDSLKAEPPTS